MSSAAPGLLLVGTIRSQLSLPHTDTALSSLSPASRADLSGPSALADAPAQLHVAVQ